MVLDDDRWVHDMVIRCRNVGISSCWIMRDYMWDVGIWWGLNGLGQGWEWWDGDENLRTTTRVDAAPSLFQAIVCEVLVHSGSWPSKEANREPSSWIWKTIFDRVPPLNPIYTWVSQCFPVKMAIGWCCQADYKQVMISSAISAISAIPLGGVGQHRPTFCGSPRVGLQGAGRCWGTSGKHFVFTDFYM